MKKMILLASLILVCTLLAGCVGLVVVHPRQKCTTQFSLGNRGELWYPLSVSAIAQSDVLEAWGQPSTIQTNRDGFTVWQYQGSLAWTTVLPAWIFGLPIPIPSGHNHVDIYLKDGIAQTASHSVDVATGAFIMAVPFGGGAGVLAWEREIDKKATNNSFVVGHGFIKEGKVEGNSH